MKKEKVIDVCTKHGATEHYLCSYKTKETNESKCIACHNELLEEKKKEYSKRSREKQKARLDWEDYKKAKQYKIKQEELKNPNLVEKRRQKARDCYYANREKYKAYAKAYKKIRMQDKEAYEHDKAYTKTWIKNNKEHVLNLTKNWHKKQRQIKIERFEKIINDNKLFITSLLFKLESSLSLNDIKNYCVKYNITNMEDIKSYIIANKRAKLIIREEWRQSAYSKYYNGAIKQTYNKDTKKCVVISDYDEFTEEEKEKIRAEYKQKAKEIVEQKMKELLKNI